MKNSIILIGLIMIVLSIGSANAITPIQLDVNLLEDGANIDTSKLVTICYNTDDASTPPNPLSVSINTVDDLDPVEGPIYLLGLYDSSYDPCTSGSDCKSKLYASFGIFSAGTDITIQVEGYEDYTFSGVTSSVGPLNADLTPAGTAPLSVTILHPNGGESIPIKTQVQVSAHATGDTAVTSVTFSYSNNSGSDWNSIGAGTKVSGTDKDGIWNITWNTNNLDAGSNYLIKAIVSDGTSSGEDQSNSIFSLITCTQPSMPTLNDPGTTDNDGSYTLSWSSVSGATSYTLEEDTSDSFGSPTIVYSDSGTSTQITGRSNGTYYYRVKGCNACGCSGWSNIVKIENVPSDSIQVTINAPDSVTDTFDANIDIKEVTNLDSGQFDLSFNSDVINVTGVDYGSISGTEIPVDNWAFIDANTIRVLFNVPGITGVSGSGSFVTVNFVVTGTVGDVSAINIINGLLVDTESNEIPAVWIGDEVSVTSQ